MDDYIIMYCVYGYNMPVSVISKDLLEWSKFQEYARSNLGIMVKKIVLSLIGKKPQGTMHVQRYRKKTISVPHILSCFSNELALSLSFAIKRYESKKAKVAALWIFCVEITIVTLARL